ncbi:hypothetical protein [Streptomyces sp. CBMA29]|uniref:hypothetical protein n=1 Tax=Streptomyces sp. CBMA29 TaxID=1896314 RepID=UPI0016619A9C|nr:hypothetical protein [Streptomyces sp. CBMA29]MBD0735318.1 hypothetical protein [Streptomyces sp. CBMA29]
MRGAAGLAAAVGAATEAARAGRYDEATRLLGEAGDAGTDPAVLDLTARIHAQRGELAEADACWAALPGSASAVAGRRRIAALQARRYRPSAGRRLTVAVLVVTAAGAMAAGVLLPRTRAPQPPDPSVARDLAAVRAEQGQLRTRLDEAVRAAAVPALTAADLSGSGVTVTREGQGFLVTFDGALFTDGATLNPYGRGALDAVAARLRRTAGAGPLVVTGHTDDTPLPPGSPYADRVTLGFARAQRAAERLAADGPVPLPSIGLRSTGTSSAPHRPGSANNTVTILVGPPAQGGS